VDGDGGVSRFREIPLEISAYWLPFSGDITPFVGVGGGVRSFWDRRQVQVTLGSTLVSTNSAVVEDSGYGFGGTVRAGAVLFRTYRLRMLVSGEYSVALLNVNGQRNPRGFRFGAGLLF